MAPSGRGSPTDLDAERQLDAEDVGRVQAGDTTAFDALIDRYQRRAVSVSYRLLGNINDAMDVCQDAFVKAFKSLDSLQDATRFGGWLMRIVTNLSLNYRRDRRQHLSLSTDDPDDDREGWATMQSDRSSPEPVESLLASETEGAVSRAIEALPEQQRVALILSAIEKMPQKEIAEILGCSVEMVKWNVFQARKTLKKQLAKHLEE